MSAPKPIYGSKGMVVSGHPLATLAGREMLLAGGSVVDAAIAAASVMTVVLPQACAIGGDAFTLVHTAAGGTVGLNGSGPAPAEATLDRFGNTIPHQGPLSCTAPAMPAAWAELHRRYGKLEWSTLLGRAIEYAEGGFPISLGLAQSIVQHRALLERSGAIGDLFLPGGKPLTAGDVLKQPALAATLKALRDRGTSAFYTGSVAADIAAAVRQAGGCLAASDFARVKVDWVTPIETSYRGRTIRVMPPNSFGLLLLLQLKALADVETKGWTIDSPARLVMLVQAARKVFAAAEHVVADPDHVDKAAIAALLSRPEAMAAAAGTGPISRSNAKGGTAIVSVADAAGNAITLVQSVFAVFGSGLWDPKTGVLINNRASGFNNKPGHPNVLAPGKRPAHTLNPAMVMEGDRLRYLIATPGGPGQTVTLTQVLSNMFDLGLDPATAIDLPRWSLEVGGRAIVETTMDRQAVATAEQQVGPLALVEAGSTYFGSTELIDVQANGALAGVADHRREAMALGA